MAASYRHSNHSESNSKRFHTKSRFAKKHEQKHEKESGPGRFGMLSRKIFIFCIAVAVSVLHRNHIAGMFENDRHFSHLSTLERELAFRTEMGLYYSYFKTLVSASTAMEGLHAIMYDNITEFPSTINTLKRFNLYPEVTLGLAYRMFDWLSNTLKWQTKTCYTVNRGEGYEPVLSCEGLGEPAYFYVESVFLLNGILMGVFFLFGTYLSGCPFGGVLTVASFFFNHGECTRVQWTPPLRESFGYPFFVFQMFVVSHMLRSSKVSYLHTIVVAALTTIFMACWQFAQFALLTQAFAVFGTYTMQYINSKALRAVILGQTVGLVTGYVLLFGNEMLLTSYFASCLVTIWAIILLEPVIDKLQYRVARWTVHGALLLAGTLGCKILISRILGVKDDAHIGEILRSKFTNFDNFHTMLYTCAKEFDFIEFETFISLLRTLLLPSAALSVCLVAFHVIKYEFSASKTQENGSSFPSKSSSSKPSAELVYNVFQLLAFTVLAVLIMRLKLFWTPHLCLMTSLLAARKLLGGLPKYSEVAHSALLVALLATMGVAGYANLKHQWGIIGEFSNYPLEEMVEWIKSSTPKDAVFAGPMPTMATIKLCTQRPIVNHPHYEDANLRERTKKVYTMYSRKPASEVKRLLKELGVQYAILENSWCIRKTRPGCAMPEIWDLEDEENQGKEPLCTLLKQNPGLHFKRVFRNSVYDVLQVNTS
ncbi:probable C-mannosyltransferase DPY19L1 isoform X2 [Pomacea canaliculata]|uniref:probable C-mannosyltransferase DPY19L1 isoform X2 n=1 Tax=Pomacea canaliculata TaxID=400727 RepID=UPI000D72898C|nr:probable C-mannosyltransferase DPY19L1 isoform X2 [Pomacea canaliculata]